MLLKGFLFGLMLQFAIGPVCLYVFRIATERGLAGGFSAVAAVCVVDMVYIACAILGFSGWAKRPALRTLFRYGGAAIIAIFAVDIIMSAAGVSFIPGLALPAAVRGSGPFLSTFVLTASNPLTILFWAGIFSDRIVRDGSGPKELVFFSAGCVLATFVFMGTVVVAGSGAGVFLPGIALRMMSAAVACVLLFFAVRLILRK